MNQETQQQDPADPVNHPSHYAAGRRFETIDVIEGWGLGFHVGNALKYLSRCGRKPGADEVQDIEKAAWYLQRWLDFVRIFPGTANPTPEILPLLEDWSPQRPFVRRAIVGIYGACGPKFGDQVGNIRMALDAITSDLKLRAASGRT